METSNLHVFALLSRASYKPGNREGVGMEQYREMGIEQERKARIDIYQKSILVQEITAQRSHKRLFRHYHIGLVEVNRL